MSEAYRSALDISFEVKAGLLMRQTHHWAANVFLVAIVLLGWAITRKPARDVCSRIFHTVASGVLLAVLGLLSLITGIFPVLGLVLLVAGIVLAIRNRSTPAVAVA